MGIFFFFSLGLVGVAALIGSARTARTVREVLLFGLFGGVLMGLNCLALKWVAGLEVGTNGDLGGFVWFYSAVFLSIASLLIYFGITTTRIYQDRQNRKRRDSGPHNSRPRTG
jgi:hypothetical protein